MIDRSLCFSICDPNIETRTFGEGGITTADTGRFSLLILLLIQRIADSTKGLNPLVYICLRIAT